MRRPSRRTAVALLLALCLALPAAALAAWDGKTDPNDPGYNGAESDPVTKCINDEQWYLFSFLPKCAPLAKDPEGAAGMSIDQAWKQFTNGRPDVRIAYVEAGVNWHRPDARQELAPRAYLNTGELPKPQGSAAYDRNGDGQVNVADYADDPRIPKPYINGDLTPEDLIVAFSDDKDADKNGYVDDISGWNFSRQNNDPATGDSAYAHANSQMKRAAAEGNNGVLGVGLCPRCTLIPIKGGDEALDRTDRVAQAVYFAADSGASVLILLDAEIGYSSLTRAALDYAWKRGMVVVGASNDFDSTDHQNGTFWPRVWPGNGLVSDQSGTLGGVAHSDRLATSYRERSNVTSFGPHSLFSAPNAGGSTSESTPTNAGVAALVAAEGRDAADRKQIAGRLDAGEIKQVVRATASNIDDPDLGWAGKPGATFNVFYGYGRPNVLRAMQAVAANRIPPVPDILGPDWYANYDPTKTKSVPIRADLAARRAKSAAYVVQYGIGPDPTEKEFQTIARGRFTGRRTGRVGTLSLSRIPRSVWEKPLRYSTDLSSTEQHTVTLRIQATDERGNLGEDRRSIHVFHDPTLRPGFPRRFAQGKEPEPVLYDLSGDGRLDLIFADADGVVRALDARSGRELPGWPSTTRRLALGMAGTRATRAHAVPIAHEPVVFPAAVGDLDGDGAPEVVVTSTTGRVYVFDARGRLRRGWPKALGANVRGEKVPPPDQAHARRPSMGAFATPVLVRLPGSASQLDVLQAAWDGRLYAWDARGRTIPGWPIDAQLPAANRPRPPYTDVHDYKLIATPTVADLDGDGRPEIVVKSQEFDYDQRVVSDLGAFSRFYVLAYHGDGNRHAGGALVAGWPARLQGTLGYYGSAQDWITEGGDSASAADIDGDGSDEVTQSTVFGIPQTIEGDGTIAKSTPPQPSLAPLAAGPDPGTKRVPTSDNAQAPVGFTTSGAYAHFGGKLTYLAGGSDLATLGALVHPGVAQRVTNFMRAYDASSGATLPGFPAPMMGLPFVTAPAVADLSGDGRPDVVNAEDTSNVDAFQAGGSRVPAWPKFTGGWTLATPAIGDLDGDGRNEAVAMTREGYMFVWNTPGKAESSEAWNWHQDDWHTGRLGTDTRPPAVPRAIRAVGRTRVCWITPGDDWSAGRAKSYELRAFSRRPTAASFPRGRLLRNTGPPLPAGRRQCATVSPRVRFVGLRARDDAGLVSWPAVLVRRRAR